MNLVFWIYYRKLDGTDYPVDSMKTTRSSLCSYLKNYNYGMQETNDGGPVDLVLSPKFIISNRAFATKVCRLLLLCFLNHSYFLYSQINALKKAGHQNGNKKSDLLDQEDLDKLTNSTIWRAETPAHMNMKLWFLLTYWFIFRAQESTWNLVQGDLIIGTTQDGERSLTFKNDKLTKTTGANTTSGRMPSRGNEKRQMERVCIEVQLIELLQAYLTKLPKSCRGPTCSVFHAPKKYSESGMEFSSPCIDKQLTVIS
jgi:hypothetical protein